MLPQVYQASSQTFLCHSKYAGRKLDEAGVRKTLHQFLHNGKELRLDLIDEIVRKLESLADTLARLNTFRFYSSSLLVMYDGAASCSGEESEAAASSQPAPAPPASASSQHHHQQQQQQEAGSTSCEHTVCDVCQQHSASSSLQQTTGAAAAVDVRMIDFAHATHSGFKDDRTRHDGPDASYLFGLQNLTAMFNDLKARHESH